MSGDGPPVDALPFGDALARLMVERGLSYRRLASMSSEVMSGEIEILRGDLVRILHHATRDVEYLFDDSIASISQQDGGVRVGFERREPRHFDFVVGADGLHSKVRALVFGIGDARDDEFLERYRPLLQKSPGLASAHGTLKQLVEALPPHRVIN